MELKVGATVGECRKKAAHEWGWAFERILLRSASGELLQDDEVELRTGSLLTAALSPYAVEVALQTVGAIGGASSDPDACVKVIVNVPSDGGCGAATLQALKDLLSRKIGIPQAAFMLHALPKEEEDDDHAGIASRRASLQPLREVSDGEPDDDEAIPEAGAQEGEQEGKQEEAAEPQPPVITDDDGFEEVLRLKATTAEGAAFAQAASRALATAAESAKLANLAATKATRAMDREQAGLAGDQAEKAKARFEEVVAAAAEADEQAVEAAARSKEAPQCLQGAKEVVEQKKALVAEAKDASKVASKALQQAKIQRKKVAQFLEASKQADADREFKIEEHARCKRAEEEARPQPGMAAAAAAAAKESATKAAAFVEAARGDVDKAAEVAAAAAEADAARKRAWLEELTAAEMLKYSPPPPDKALRDDDELEALGYDVVLCRIRPRAARALSELAMCNELSVSMCSQCDYFRVAPWTLGVAKTQRLLSICFSTRSGDLAFQADGMFTWRVALRGPVGSWYEGGTFWLRLDLSAEWPRLPPQLRFQSPIYHCNVSEDGSIHWDAAPFRKVRDTWTRESTIFSLFGAVLSLLCVPDAEAAARPELAKLLVDHREAFSENAKQHTRQHASARVVAVHVESILTS